MQRGPIRFIEPVAGVEREQLHLGPFRQRRGLIDYQSPGVDAGFNRHGLSLALGGPPIKPLQPTSGGCRGLRREIVTAARG
jgi:hypothetical protein